MALSHGTLPANQHSEGGHKPAAIAALKKLSALLLLQLTTNGIELRDSEEQPESRQVLRRGAIQNQAKEPSLRARARRCCIFNVQTDSTVAYYIDVSGELAHATPESCVEPIS